MRLARVCSFLGAGLVSCLMMLGTASKNVEAATMSCTSAATYSLSDASNAACFSGNDTNQIDATFSLFGSTGWILSDKNDDASAGDGTIEFTTAPINGAQSGNWAIDTLAGLSEIVITLKAGNGFGAFLLDLTVPDPLSGSWASTKDLSHASIYYNGDPVSAVPLPAALPLFLSALAGLGLLGWRRKRIATA